MAADKGYGRLAAAVNSLLALLLLTFASAAAGHAQSAPIKLAMLGDSLTAGFGLSPGQAIPAQLQNALKAQGRDVVVLNHGVSGDTTAGGLGRVDWMLGDKPDIVLVELGANDSLRALDPLEAERNLAAIIEKLQAAKISVWLAGMLAPRNFGPEYDRAFDAIYPRLADKYKVPLYPFILDGAAGQPELNQPDGLHPNAKGVAVIVEHLMPFVTANLDAHATTVHRPARP
jgi:acyl-CoA thioesterase-1